MLKRSSFKISPAFMVFLAVAGGLLFGMAHWLDLRINQVQSLIDQGAFQQAEEELEGISSLKDRSLPKRWRARIIGLHTQLCAHQGKVELAFTAWKDELDLLIGGDLHDFQSDSWHSARAEAEARFLEEHKSLPDDSILLPPARGPIPEGEDAWKALSSLSVTNELYRDIRLVRDDSLSLSSFMSKHADLIQKVQAFAGLSGSSPVPLKEAMAFDTIAEMMVLVFRHQLANEELPAAVETFDNSVSLLVNIINQADLISSLVCWKYLSEFINETSLNRLVTLPITREQQSRLLAALEPLAELDFGNLAMRNEYADLKQTLTEALGQTTRTDMDKAQVHAAVAYAAQIYAQLAKDITHYAGDSRPICGELLKTRSHWVPLLQGKDASEEQVIEAFLAHFRYKAVVLASVGIMIPNYNEFGTWEAQIKKAMSRLQWHEHALAR